VSEIERKWLVAELPAELGDGDVVRQGYVALDGDVEVRVRERAGSRSLTVKGGSGLERDEVELALTQDEFDGLWPLAADRSLEKVRHVVDVSGHEAEIDVYRGRHEDLCVVEVEFDSTEEAEAFGPPSWFGREVTGDDHWSNRSLAANGPPES
jgi:adenylate cyclase